VLSFISRLPCTGAKVQYSLLYYCLRALPAAVPLNWFNEGNVKIPKAAGKTYIKNLQT
jgi:hypothetical protein